MFLLNRKVLPIFISLIFIVSSCGVEHPIEKFDYGISEGKLIEQTSYTQERDTLRNYHDIALDTGRSGTANITVSLPQKIPPEGLPCIIVLAGFETGKKSLQYIPVHGNYSLISFEYPLRHKSITKWNIPFHLLPARHAFFQTPSQITTVARWAQQQPWSNKKPVIILGFSFGGLFIPAVYHLAQKQNLKLGPGVIGYAGADLYTIYYENIPESWWFRSPLASFFSYLTSPLDPVHHLPHLKGEFLLINGLQDKKIPWSSAKKLHELTPEPKTIIKLDTAHMYKDNTELLLRLNNISKEWLEKRLP